MKAAFTAIVGRPSVGKSTLLNALCGFKVSITSPVPQTTRNKVRGIITDERGQIVFVDTPGFHESDKKINLQMKELVEKTIEEVDLILYMLDATRSPGREEQALLELLRPHRDQVIIALNKCDVKENEADILAALVVDYFDPSKVVRISAAEEKGLDELKKLIFAASPEGEQMYPKEYYTDQDPEFRSAEIIREKAIELARQELPHALYVEIGDMELEEEADKLWIRAFIWVERETQKGMLVGKGGDKIKHIRVSAQRELQRIFGRKVHLDVRVKVNQKWRRKDGLLKKLIR